MDWIGDRSVLPNDSDVCSRELLIPPTYRLPYRTYSSGGAQGPSLWDSWPVGCPDTSDVNVCTLGKT